MYIYIYIQREREREREREKREKREREGLIKNIKIVKYKFFKENKGKTRRQQVKIKEGFELGTLSTSQEKGVVAIHMGRGIKEIYYYNITNIEAFSMTIQIMALIS